MLINLIVHNFNCEIHTFWKEVLQSIKLILEKIVNTPEG